MGALEPSSVVLEPLRPRREARWHQERLRRPSPDLAVDYPGALVQVDIKQVVADRGKVAYQFGAVDCFTRKRVVALAPRLTSAHGAAFLRRVVAQFPFPVEAVQSDGGSECLKGFVPVAKELKLTHYFNHPNYPPGNGRIERSFRTDEDEFYQVEEMPAHLGGIEAALLQWNHVLPSGRTILLHQALAYKTPEQFYQDWLTTHTRKEGLLSDMP